MLTISDIYGHGTVSASPMPASQKVYWKSSLMDTQQEEELEDDDTQVQPDFMSTLRSEKSLRQDKAKPPASSYLKSHTENDDKYDIPKLRGDQLGLPRLTEAQLEQLHGPARAEEAKALIQTSSKKNLGSSSS